MIESKVEQTDAFGRKWVPSMYKFRDLPQIVYISVGSDSNKVDLTFYSKHSPFKELQKL